MLFRRTAWLASLLAPLPALLAAQAGIVEGRVRGDTTDRPVADAAVTLLETGRRVFTDRDGRFRFAGLASGRYTLEARHLAWRGARASVTVVSGEAPVVVELVLTTPMSTLAELEARGERGRARRVITASEEPTLAPKKNEVIEPATTDAALALNNTRQTFARVPGMMIWEQDPAGIQAGVSVRGLSPNRSWEFNVRQNGVDISSDAFGYPEAYYTPPFESLERVEIVRGAASLQYGPQFGGLLNYVTKRGATDRALAIESTQLTGTGGLYSPYTAVGGTVRGVNYYTYLNHRSGDGWRRASDFRSTTGHVGVVVPVGRGSVAASATLMDARLRQPGGLTETQFTQDVRQAGRERDWFGVPWFVPQLTWTQPIGERTTLRVNTFGLIGERNSVGLTTAPTVSDNGANPRRVDRDRYENVGTEARLTTRLGSGPRAVTLASGVRASYGITRRYRGRGTDGTAADWTITGARTLDFRFGTTNAALFTEAAIPLGERVTITPGARLEHLRMAGEGTFASSNATFLPTGAANAFNQTRSETLPLFGVGLSVRATRTLEVYGNLAQNWRPTTFAERFPNDLVAVDPNLRSARGVSADAGVRGSLGALLAFDVGGFWLDYDDRIGVLTGAALGAQQATFPNGLRANVGRSRHYGAEGYLELDALAALVGQTRAARHGALSLFTSVGWTVADYRSGPAAGRQVENSPDWVLRAGVQYRYGTRVNLGFQASRVTGTFSDASNTPFLANGTQGWIPAYTVLDASARVRVTRNVGVQLNVNNLLDRRYFTRRATGYPGPGIVPADGRMVVAGLVFGM